MSCEHVSHGAWLLDQGRRAGGGSGQVVCRKQARAEGPALIRLRQSRENAPYCVPGAPPLQWRVLGDARDVCGMGLDAGRHPMPPLVNTCVNGPALVPCRPYRKGRMPACSQVCPPAQQYPELARCWSWVQQGVGMCAARVACGRRSTTSLALALPVPNCRGPKRATRVLQGRQAAAGAGSQLPAGRAGGASRSATPPHARRPRAVLHKKHG